ncbi:GMC family oxidoreductase N-terminal domain-containing protein [Pseudenhygromyxa sp. WMMC2535]|nr:GMC family oxidoreductase N-terminal domain-containing protein [Pseudenhygromyxa sp. WMMC2535]
MDYDTIIVGAGSAGCVIAARLSADKKRRVLLVEAGRRTRDLRVQAPGLAASLWRTKFDWGFRTEPQPHMAQRRNYWPRGKVLGGTSCLNYMIYMRGHRGDYDGWRDEGNEGWGYDDVLPYFKRSEDNADGGDHYHGVGGPLRVTRKREAEICHRLAAAAADALDAPLIDDVNAPEREGFGPFPLTIRGGQRCHTGAAFLDPVMGRPNLEVIEGAVVERITFSGGRATGIRYRRGGEVITARAGGEVVLCAGAIGSPQLLLRSGVGPGEALHALGIAVSHELPGVGKNLQDHLFVPAGYEVEAEVAGEMEPVNLLRWLGRYVVSRAGPLSSSGAEAGGFVRSREDVALPDLQLHFLGTGPSMASLDDSNYTPEGRGCSLMPTLLYPESVGELRLRSADPEDPPIIDPHYLEAEADVDTLLRGVRMVHQIVEHPEIRPLLGRALTPMSRVDASDALIRADIRARASTLFHPVGTCKMGTDETAVVDAELRVHGIEGLRVADASIMPRIVGGNTNAPCVMIGEKAAALLGGPWPSP